MPRGKAKGSEFERKIAKEIVKAFRHFGMTQRDCWRSTMSGGHDRAVGDLEMSKDLLRLFPFCLEMKHRKLIRIENFFMDKKSEELSWIDQVTIAASKNKSLTPVIVMRGNHKQILALVGPRSEVHDDGAELWIAGQMWKLMLWSKFLKMAVALAKGEDTREYRK